MSLSERGIVDTHCHMWQIELARQTWLKPEFGPLFRTFQPEDLSKASQEVGVDKCVLVEAGKTEEETRSLERMAASGLIGAFIPFVDLANPALENELDRWQKNIKFRGVRMGFEGHSDPDILLRPAITQGLRAVARRGLVFEFLVRVPHLKDMLRVYERIPDLNGVIEHMAKPDLVGRGDSEEWRQQMIALAHNTRVTCKVSLSPRVEEMGQLLARPGGGWPAERIKPYVQFLIEHFGCDRLMWGSDWPVALLASDYAGTYRTMRQAIGPLEPADELKLFHDSAARFYRLPNPGEE
ncbi:MAG: amidohydrolase family protein [Chloroflexi bacterium]|nr:amidohydrolase family protein [Chloroflexota bacterium]